ncbi:hypothetical protein LMG27952_07022 [Paraburkholderia hiiakae]|uniref:Uncharacterized protein n=1 Tax=Paraburkholderia hiiakae TaxID=1081782 RepID=A0ABM8P9P3_9BURK|nr:hypothetical protein LMG27952_07022 [Paraburkholderia hiiakae]
MPVDRTNHEMYDAAYRDKDLMRTERPAGRRRA